MSLSYAFDPSRDTPQSLARRRDRADALAASIFSKTPQNFGEGLGMIGQALMLRNMESQIRDGQVAGNATVPAWLGGTGANPAAPVADAAAPMGALPGMGPPVAPMAPSVNNKIYSNDEPSPLDPPSGKDRDLLIRTVYGEDPGSSASGVANVVRNRAISGKFGGDTIPGVVLAKNQFEPWNNDAARARMQALDPTSPTYDRLGKIVDEAYTGTNDPTNGATHFFAPKAQAALGRDVPAWGRQGGQDIGVHRFFGGARQAPVQVAQADADPMAIPANAQPTQGYALPGQAAARSGSLFPNVSDEMLAKQLVNPFATPEQRNAIGMEIKMRVENNKTGTLDLGDRIAVTDRNGNIIRYHNKGEPVKGASFVDGPIDPATGQPTKVWINPRDQSVTQYSLPKDPNAPASTIPPVPAGVDPKAWHDAHSKRATDDALPASSADSSKLRNEVQGLPSYKNLAQAAPVYRSMFDAAGRDTRAADLNMIYGMGKIMDPGSVVREGEMGLAQSIATLPQQLRATVESQLAGNGRLSPEVRASIMQEARSRIQAYRKSVV